MTDTQQQLLDALNTPNRKARANIMLILAQQGDASVIKPLLDAINTRPILSPAIKVTNSGNTMLDAVMTIAQRYPEEAKPHLIELMGRPIEEKSFWASLTDKDHIAATARHEIASTVLAALMEDDLLRLNGDTLADHLFNAAKPK